MTDEDAVNLCRSIAAILRSKADEIDEVCDQMEGMLGRFPYQLRRMGQVVVADLDELGKALHNPEADTQ